TYIIKVIYTDDNYSFKLSRVEHPSIVITCIPNGEISKLFDFNIIDNIKTYDYFSETDGEYYKMIEIPPDLTKGEIESFVERECVSKRSFNKVNIGNKTAYFDMATRTLWWKTSHQKRKVIRAVKSGS